MMAKPEPEIVDAWKRYKASDIHADRLAQAKERGGFDEVIEFLLFMTWVGGYREGQRNPKGALPIPKARNLPSKLRATDLDLRDPPKHRKRLKVRKVVQS
jgi:hypothetical protein